MSLKKFEEHIDFNDFGSFKMFVLQNFPFIEEDFDSLTYYEMLCKIVGYLKDVIENNKELSDLFSELQNYVEHYFDNLDVQEEVNKKLDSLVETGELTELITDYINMHSLICYNTVTELKESQNLINGSFAEVLGYYSVNDGGKATYKIRTKESSDIIDNGKLIPIGSNLVAELIVIDNTVNVKNFGAVGNGETDDSDAIQNAINYFHVGTDDENQNYLTQFLRVYKNAYGKVIFEKSDYKITKTINVPCYVDIDFHNSKINCDLDSGYAFSINSVNCGSWTYGYVSRKGYFKNGRFETTKNIGALYVLDARKLEHLQFDNFRVSIYYPSSYNNTAFYIDNIFIDDINISSEINTEYQIQKRCSGDTIIINHVHFPTSYVSINDFMKGIFTATCKSGTISNLLNGIVEIYNSNLQLNNCYIEKGKIYIKNSKVSLNDCSIEKRNENDIPITVMDLTDGYDQKTLPVVLNNTIIVNYYSNEDFNFDNYDIDMTRARSILQLNNSYKEIRTKGINFKSLCGLHILLDGNKEIKNIYDNAYIKEKLLFSDERIANSTAFGSSAMGNLSTTNTNMDWKIQQGTYFYKTIILSDEQRLLGASSSPEKSIAIMDSGVKISMDLPKVSHNIIRIYRGTSSGNYSKYVDIPNPQNYYLFDNGLSCNGYKWLDNTSGTIPEIQSCRGGYYTYNLSDNVKNFHAETLSIYPNTNGKFESFDTITRLNAGLGDSKKAYCQQGGTPGTWFKSPVLEEL